MVQFSHTPQVWEDFRMLTDEKKIISRHHYWALHHPRKRWSSRQWKRFIRELNERRYDLNEPLPLQLLEQYQHAHRVRGGFTFLHRDRVYHGVYVRDILGRAWVVSNEIPVLLPLYEEVFQVFGWEGKVVFKPGPRKYRKRWGKDVITRSNLYRALPIEIAQKGRLTLAYGLPGVGKDGVWINLFPPWNVLDRVRVSIERRGRGGLGLFCFRNGTWYEKMSPLMVDSWSSLWKFQRTRASKHLGKVFRSLLQERTDFLFDDMIETEYVHPLSSWGSPPLIQWYSRTSQGKTVWVKPVVSLKGFSDLKASSSVRFFIVFEEDDQKKSMIYIRRLKKAEFTHPGKSEDSLPRTQSRVCTLRDGVLPHMWNTLQTGTFSTFWRRYTALRQFYEAMHGFFRERHLHIPVLTLASPVLDQIFEATRTFLKSPTRRDFFCEEILNEHCDLEKDAWLIFFHFHPYIKLSCVCEVDPDDILDFVFIEHDGKLLTWTHSHPHISKVMDSDFGVFFGIYIYSAWMEWLLEQWNGIWPQMSEGRIVTTDPFGVVCVARNGVLLRSAIPQRYKKHVFYRPALHAWLHRKGEGEIQAGMYCFFQLSDMILPASFALPGIEDFTIRERNEAMT